MDFRRNKKTPISHFLDPFHHLSTCEKIKSNHTDTESINSTDNPLTKQRGRLSQLFHSIPAILKQLNPFNFSGDLSMSSQLSKFKLISLIALAVLLPILTITFANGQVAGIDVSSSNSFNSVNATYQATNLTRRSAATGYDSVLVYGMTIGQWHNELLRYLESIKPLDQWPVDTYNDIAVLVDTSIDFLVLNGFQYDEASSFRQTAICSIFEELTGGRCWTRRYLIESAPHHRETYSATSSPQLDIHIQQVEQMIADGSDSLSVRRYVNENMQGSFLLDAYRDTFSNSFEFWTVRNTICEADTAGVALEDAKGAIQGGGLGSVFGPWGAAIGAVVGAVVYSVDEYRDQQQQP